MEPSSYITKPLFRSDVCRFFVSSGSDVATQRDTFERLVTTVNHQYRRWNNGRLTLDVDRWEHDAARRADGRPNDEFVRRAVAAHCTVVLLASTVRAGTLEEIQAVLQAPATQLAVIRMREPKRHLRDKALRQFLESHQSDFMYEVTGPPGSELAMLSMIKVVAAALATVTDPTRPEGLFYEER